MGGNPFLSGSISGYIKEQQKEYLLWSKELVRELSQKSTDSRLYSVFGGGQYWFSSYREAMDFYHKWDNHCLMEHTYDPETDSLDEGEFVWVRGKDKKYPFKEQP